MRVHSERPRGRQQFPAAPPCNYKAESPWAPKLSPLAAPARAGRTERSSMSVARTTTGVSLPSEPRPRFLPTVAHLTSPIPARSREQPLASLLPVLATEACRASSEQPPARSPRADRAHGHLAA